MSHDHDHDLKTRLSRRDVLAAAGTTAAAVMLGCAGRDAAGAAPSGTAPSGTAPSGTAPSGTAPSGTAPSGTAQAAPSGAGKTVAGRRMPAVYLPHGGGPWPFVDLPMGEPAELDALATYLRGLPALLPEPPRALLVISAHWEASVPTLMTSARPPMLYDYYGFPAEAYRITWPAPGAPELAGRVRKLVSAAGFTPTTDPARGFDHGTFVPLKLAYPDANVPTLQLSLVRGLDPTTHLALGRALAPLRDEGVFIVGSGMSYHNMSGFRAAMSGVRRGAAPLGGDFDDWLAETIALPPAQRNDRLIRWAEAPGARASHPREEHLLPLMVVAGAAGAGVGQVGYSGTLMGTRISGIHFA